MRDRILSANSSASVALLVSEALSYRNASDETKRKWVKAANQRIEALKSSAERSQNLVNAPALRAA